MTYVQLLRYRLQSDFRLRTRVIMDADSLFWALSTLPQVNAALLAFIGFLVLDRLSKIDARCAVIEDLIKDTPYDVVKLFLLTLNKNDTRGLALRTMDGAKMMKFLIAEIDKNPEVAKVAAGHVEADIAIWKPLNHWREETRLQLKIFVGFNFSILILSLFLLPFCKLLSSYSAVMGAVWFVVVLLAGVSAAMMIYQVLWRPQP